MRRAAALGRAILRAAPWLMKFLSVAGTAAMFLVGGGILTHGVHAVGEWIRDAAVDAAAMPGAGAVLGALMPMLANAARRHRRRRARRAGDELFRRPTQA